MGNLLSKLSTRESQPVTVPSGQVQASSSLRSHNTFDNVNGELVREESQSPQSTSYGGITFPFTRLPPEIRIMIWEEARPKARRILTSPLQSTSGSRFCPPPPAIASVCRESRRVALKYGCMHEESISIKHSGWFNRAEDVVVWIDRDGASQSTRAVNRSVEHLAIFWNPFSMRGGFSHQQARTLSTIKGIARGPKMWDNLRTIDIIFSSSGEYLVGGNWEPAVVEELFGDDTVVTIDLKDENECSHALDLLQKTLASQHQLDTLTIARHIIRGQEHDCLYSWAKLVEAIQYTWLESSYQRENGSVADAILVNGAKAGWDLDHPWIKRTLAGIPELRPIIMLAREDHTWKPRRSWPIRSVLNHLE